MIKASPFLALAVALLALSACGRTDSAPAAGDQASAPAPAPSANPGFAPLSSRGGSAPAQPAPAAGAEPSHRIDAPGVSFQLPPTWRPERPSSSMRLAQAAIPGSGGEGQLTVFYFGPGGGGPVEDNLQRWLGQMVPDPGQSPQRESFATGSFQVTLVDVVGTLQPSTMGTGPTTPQPGSRLLGAVVEGSQGPWFFKATGPAQTLAEHRQGFLDLVKSATVQP